MDRWLRFIDDEVIRDKTLSEMCLDAYIQGVYDALERVVVHYCCEECKSSEDVINFSQELMRCPYDEDDLDDDSLK